MDKDVKRAKRSMTHLNTLASQKVFDPLNRGFSTWGACNPRGTFAYSERVHLRFAIKEKIYLCIIYFQMFIHT